jgi:hypothetical protein
LTEAPYLVVFLQPGNLLMAKVRIASLCRALFYLWGGVEWSVPGNPPQAPTWLPQPGIPAEWAQDGMADWGFSGQFV